MTAKQRLKHKTPRIALVLGGGGIKGFAHIGVLRALAARGIKPSVYAGTSIGALIAAAAVGGLSPDDMAHRAESLRRRDVFRLNHFGVLVERMRASAIYLEEPLRDLCRAVVPPVKFSDLPLPLLVNSVDLDRGTQLVWGLPGLQDVFVNDAVYASCALPGYFPPGRVGGRICVDGGVIDNLPVSVAALNADLIIAADVGSGDLTPVPDVAAQGFAATYMRAATTMMHALQRYPLAAWRGPPMILIRPKVSEDWLSFAQTAANIIEGQRAAEEALEHYDAYLGQTGGIFPRRMVEVGVIRDRCISCGLCTALAPDIMGLDASGKAFARRPTNEWSPADGDFVHHCPTDAITVRRLEHLGPPAPARDSGTSERAAEAALKVI